MPKRYRSRSEIICAVLRAAEGGAARTRVMYGARVSHAQLLRYLDLAIEEGLLRYDEETQVYDLTERGLRLIHLMEDLEKLMDMPVEQFGESKVIEPHETSRTSYTFGAF